MIVLDDADTQDAFCDFPWALVFFEAHAMASFYTALRSLTRKQVLLSLVRNLLVQTRVLLSLVPRAFRRLEASSDGRADPDGGSLTRA